MEENETVDPEYQKGFNEGYTMKKYLPEIADKLADAMGDSSRGLGFKDGRQELLVEQQRDKYPSWRRTDWLDKGNERGIEERTKDIGKDIEDPEPEL